MLLLHFLALCYNFSIDIYGEIMKKILTTTILVISLLSGNIMFAQDSQVVLPSAGLTPDSTFYFLDRLGENLRQFFTFNPEAKAKLQIEFAGERIAEIKVMVNKKEPETKGIEKAKSLLLSNVAYAAEIVNQEKVAGKDVSAFAKNLDNEFDAREKLLTQTFLEAREKLLAERKEIKDKLLKDAQMAGDTAKVAELTQQINNIQNQTDSLKEKKDEIKKDLRTEKEKIEQEMNQEDQKGDEIKQKQEDQEEQKQEEQIEPEEAPEPEEPAEAPEVKEPKEKQEKLEMNREGNNSQTQGTSTEEGE